MTSAVTTPCRSALYMPASNPRALEKSRSLDCDAVIFDLEDAVAPDAKPAARDQAVAAVAAGGFGRRQVVIRINGLDTPWGDADLRSAVSARPDAILAPKINDAEDVARYHARMGDSGTRLWVMIETAASLFQLQSIARASASSRLSCFVLGTNDLAKETGARLLPGRASLLTALSLSIAAARSCGLTVLDGVYNDIGDVEGFEAECRDALTFGFDGKTLIHPTQIEPCNRVFTPTAEEIAFAQAVVSAFAEPKNASLGVVKVEGRMTERLHLSQAQRLLAMATAVGAI